MPKGITPVIAIVLLLLITISLVGFSTVFFQRTAESAAQSGEQQLRQQVQAQAFSIEGADRNRVYIRNRGNAPLTGLAFFVNNEKIDSNNATIQPGQTAEVMLNDRQLAVQPDPAELRVSSAGFTDSVKSQCFYCRYYAGYWKLDEGSGTSAMDSSRNGNHATLYNSVNYVGGVYGNALSFDAIDDEARAFDNTILKPSGDWTLSAWIKARSTVSSDRIAVGKTGWHGGLVYQGSNMYFSISNNVGVTRSIQYTPVIGTWYHYTAVYTANNSGMRLYVNGSLVGSATFDIPPMYAYSDTLYMGGSADNPPTSYHTPVDIDDVKIMPLARSMSI